MAPANQKANLFSLPVQSYNGLHFSLGKLRKKPKEILLSFEDTQNSHRAQNLQQPLYFILGVNYTFYEQNI